MRKLLPMVLVVLGVATAVAVAQELTPRAAAKVSVPFEMLEEPAPMPEMQGIDLIYDDGTPDAGGYYWSGAGYGSGVRMTPPQYPAKVLRLSYYINTVDYLGLGDGSFTATVYDFTDAPGSELLSVPVTPTTTGWFDVDVSGYNLTVQQEFLSAMIYDGASTPTFGFDTANNGRGWDYYVDSGWEFWPETYFMRATVQIPTAVELTSFTAAALEGAVRLDWQTAGELDHAGFAVYRSEQPEVEGMRALNTTLIQGDSYLDGTVLPGRTYYYWLEDVDLFGLGSVHGPVEVTTVGGPATVWLAAPRPNPCPGVVTVRFCLPREGEVSLALYDMAGRKVASVHDGARMGAGWHEASWGPSDGALPAGRYLCRVRFGDSEASRPLVVVK